MPLNNGAINEILPFGHGAGANVMTQAEYLADVARTAGNQSGLARSKFVNKIWRQGAHLVAGVGQWIANRYAPGVRDNGDLDAIEAGMTAAVRSCAATSWPLMVLDWDAVTNYARKTLVFGPDGRIYIWLKASGPGVGGVGAKQPGAAGSEGFWLDYALSIAPPTQKVEKYDLCEFYGFRHPTLKPGFQPGHGGLLYNVPALYPKAWAYLQTVEGQKLCITEAQWQAMVNAVWHTNADGSKVGWNGIGGAPFYVVNTGNGTLRLPDLRGMYMEAAGFDSLGVGGVHLDQMQGHTFGTSTLRLRARPGFSTQSGGALAVWGEAGFRVPGTWDGWPEATIVSDGKSGTPRIGNATKVRAWGSLACVYLGL